MNITNMDIPDISRLRINNTDDNVVDNQQQPERNIDYLLQNPEHMITTTPLVQEHLHQQVDNIDVAFENINLNSNADSMIDTTELNEDRRNPLYSKIVPLEVANYYCREYFDDEDFVYMRFELPNDLLEEIMESGNKTVTEYFDIYLNNVEIAEDDITGLNYFMMYNNCVKVYDTILEHYMPEWYDYDGPIDEDKQYTKFDTQWTHNCRIMLDLINNVLTLGMTDESMEYLCNYNKEVYTGLFIIMTRLKELFLHFNDKSAVDDFIDYNKDYRNITIRLVNNICVILLYLKFYYLNNSIEGKERDIVYSDKMITVEE
jgi:hypothetical protein